MEIQEPISRVTQTVFSCSCCNSTLDYVQLIGNANNVEKDFFICDNCGCKIESVVVEEEEVPAFFD